MYFNSRTNQIIDNVPLNGYYEDNTLVQGLNITDALTQKLCGILPIKSDSPSQPEYTTEDIAQRQIIIEDDGVIILRVWVPITPPENIIPSTVSPRQIRLWLVEHGISLSTIDSAINSIEDELLKEKTKIEWEFSPYVERQHPMINTIGSILGLSVEQIDIAFTEASTL